jgi:hypothetical protein
MFCNGFFAKFLLNSILLYKPPCGYVERSMFGINDMSKMTKSSAESPGSLKLEYLKNWNWWFLKNSNKNTTLVYVYIL